MEVSDSDFDGPRTRERIPSFSLEILGIHDAMYCRAKIASLSIFTMSNRTFGREKILQSLLYFLFPRVILLALESRVVIIKRKKKLRDITS